MRLGVAPVALCLAGRVIGRWGSGCLSHVLERKVETLKIRHKTTKVRHKTPPNAENSCRLGLEFVTGRAVSGLEFKTGLNARPATARS